MKKRRSLALLTAVLMALTGGYLVLNYALPDSSANVPSVTEESVPIFSTAAEEIGSLSWSSGEEVFSFTRTSEGWVYDAEKEFPADGEQLDELTQSLLQATALKTITGSDDLSQYGLDEPVLTVSYGGESSGTLIFGETADLSSGRYCSDGTVVYLTDSSLSESFPLTLSDLARKEEISAPANVSSFNVMNSSGSLSAEYLPQSSLIYTNDYSWFTPAEAGTAALDTSLTEDLLSKAVSLELGDYAAVCTTAEALDAYGLMEPDITVTLSGTSPVSDETSTEITPVELAFSFGADADGVTYVRIADSPVIWHVDVSVYEAFSDASVQSLLPEKAFSLDWADVYEAGITLDGETHTVIRKECELVPSTGNASDNEETADTEPMMESYWTLDDEEAPVNMIIDALNSVSFVGVVSGDESAQMAEVEFILSRENDYYPVTQVTFYRYDATQCLAAIDGKFTALVSRSDVIALKEAIYAIILA